MAHPDLVTQKLQSTYFNVLYAYFIIGPNVRWHYAAQYVEHADQHGPSTHPQLDSDVTQLTYQRTTINM